MPWFDSNAVKNIPYGAPETGEIQCYPGDLGGQTFTMVADRLYFIPMVCGHNLDIDALVFEVGTLAAGANARVGIYKAKSLYRGKPGDLLVDAGTASVATTGVKTVTFTAITLTPGLYFTAVVSDGTPGLYGTSLENKFSNLIPNSTINQHGAGHCYQAHTYAALPDPAGTVTIVYATHPPQIAWRAA